MVGISSPPNNLVMLAFRQLIAVTKFATGPRIQERYARNLRDFNSAYKGPISERCKI